MATTIASLLAILGATLMAASLSLVSANGSGFVSLAFAAPKLSVFKCWAISSSINEKKEDASSSISQRLALTLLAGVATVGTLTLGVSPALAAYGEAANVFGSSKAGSGFSKYSGEDFTVKLPAK